MLLGIIGLSARVSLQIYILKCSLIVGHPFVLFWGFFSKMVAIIVKWHKLPFPLLSTELAVLNSCYDSVLVIGNTLVILVGWTLWKCYMGPIAKKEVKVNFISIGNCVFVQSQKDCCLEYFISYYNLPAF